MDRLADDEIVEIFKFVKSIADFPYFKYLLVFDTEIVGKALDNIQSENGFKYIDKIVQVPFSVPEIDKDDLINIFLDKFTNIVDEQWDELQKNREFTGFIFEGLPNYVKSIRDINRLINSFSFTYSILYHDVNILDLLVIETLRVFEPGIYRLLCENRIRICGDAIPESNLSPSTLEGYKQLGKDIENKAHNKDAAQFLIGAIFPAIRHFVKGQFYAFSQYDEKTYVSKRKIACNEFL